MGTPNTREFDEVLRSLCSPWREELDRLEPGKKAMVSELRFRTGCPMSLTIRGEPWFMDQQGLLQKAPIGTASRPTQSEMDELVAALCDYSVHTHAQEIREGYISLPGGSRAGLCGQAVLSGRGDQRHRAGHLAEYPYCPGKFPVWQLR